MSALLLALMRHSTNPKKKVKQVAAQGREEDKKGQSLKRDRNY